MGEKKDWRKSPRETGGPVVKSGPTKGDNRSRNNDGSWRAKRSDAGKTKKSGCFLTTSACEYKGLPDDCHELEVLRRFRDDHLSVTAQGRALVERYYQIAPSLAERLTCVSDLEFVWANITACVDAVEHREYTLAVHIYTSMVFALQQRLAGAEA